MNKKGVALRNIFVFLIMALLIVILLGTYLFAYNAITVSLLTSGATSVGAANLTEATEDTLGQINNAALTHTNVIAIMFLFAMAFSLIFAAYLTRDQVPAIFFVVDLLIIIFAYILAVYISNAYERVLESIPFPEIFITNLSMATSFLLRLPKITLIIGAIIMIVSYAAIPKSKEEVRFGGAQ